jgi:hypothetical protein
MRSIGEETGNERGLTPVIDSESLDQDGIEAPNEVRASLTTENVTEVDSHVGVKQEDPAEVVRRFPEEQGFRVQGFVREVGMKPAPRTSTPALTRQSRRFGGHARVEGGFVHKGTGPARAWISCRGRH